MKNTVLVLLLFGFVVRGETQSSCFTLDSIPVNHFVRIVYQPTDTFDATHSFDVINHKIYGLIISYTVPIIWVGVEIHEFEPQLIDDSLRIKIDLLLCQGQQLSFLEGQKSIKKLSKLKLLKGVGNIDPDSLWGQLYLQVEEEQFGGQIDLGLYYQRNYLKKIAKYIPGCYYIRNVKVNPLLSEKIKLKKVHSQKEIQSDRCYWCFLRDKVVMSGPCFEGNEMIYNWELRQALGYQYLCLMNVNSQGDTNTCLYTFTRRVQSENNVIFESLGSSNFKFYPPILYKSPALLLEKGYNALD